MEDVLALRVERTWNGREYANDDVTNKCSVCVNVSCSFSFSFSKRRLETLSIREF